MEFEEEFDITIPTKKRRRFRPWVRRSCISRNIASNVRRVVITGMGVVTALGDTVDRFWSGLIEGRSGVAPLTLFDTTDFKVHFGGPGPRFRPRGSLWLQGSAAARPLRAVRDGRRRLGHRRLGDRFRRDGSTPRGRLHRLGPWRPQRVRDAVLHVYGAGPLQDQPVHDSQADGQRRRGPGSIPLRPARANSAVATACASAANAIGDAFKIIQAGLRRRHGHRWQRGGDHPHGSWWLRGPACPFNAKRRPNPRQPPL